jgi:hypothetical protein
MKTLATSKPVVILQASGNTTWASGLVVMTSRLQRGDRLFNSGLAHYLLSKRIQPKLWYFGLILFLFNFFHYSVFMVL